MDKPLVSIIINNYNYGRFLRDAIDSALNQTYRHTEVIVVDDGSRDNSQAVIESYGQRIVPVLKSNGGQASAFNAGFRVARGELIHFLDADDAMLPHCTQQVVDAVAGRLETVAKIHFRLQYMDSAGRKMDLLIPPPGRYLPRGDLRASLAASGTADFPATSGNVFTRHALERIMPVPETLFRLCADNHVCRLAPLFGEVVAIDEPLVLYRAHDSNVYATEGKVMDDRQLDRLLSSRSIMFRGIWQNARTHGDWFAPDVASKFKALYLMSELARAVVLRGEGPDGPMWLAPRAASLLARNSVIPLHKRVGGIAWVWLVALLPHKAALTLIKRSYGFANRPVPAPATSVRPAEMTSRALEAS